MRTSNSLPIALGLLFGQAAAVPANAVDPKCQQNNCLRAIVAGSFPNRPTVTDCSSYQLKTVTPAPYTSTVWATITPVTLTSTSTSTEVDTSLTTGTASESTTVSTQTVTTTFTAAPLLAKRDSTLDIADLVLRPTHQEKRQVTVSPSSQPTYASVCSTPGAYASACSCIGVTATTTTVATPTVVVTSTSTATGSTTVGQVVTVTTTISQTVTETESLTDTATATATVYPIPTLFKLKVVGAGQDGKYLGAGYPITVQSSTSGQFYRLDGTSWVRNSDGLTANTDVADMSGIYFNSVADIAAFGYNTPACQISASNLEFTCSAPGQTSFQYCAETQRFIIAGSPVTGCEAVQLIAIKATGSERS